MNTSHMGNVLSELRRKMDADHDLFEEITYNFNLLISNGAEPCPRCSGAGEERYCDAAGSMGYRICSKCDGYGWVVR